MIANIFKSPFGQKEVSYDSSKYKNIPVDEVFQAEYKYGPEEEQILKQNILINFFQSLIARLFQAFAYPGASMKLDQERVLKTKHQLKAIGAKFLSLKTPDRDTLEGIHLKASDFKASIRKYFYVYQEKNDPYNSSEKVLILRDKFCNKTRKGFLFSYTRVTPNEEAKKFIDLIEGLKFTNSYFGSMPSEKKVQPGNVLVKTIDYVESFFINKVHGYNLPFYSLAQSAPNLPSIEEKRSSNPTVIIAGGNNTTYGSYKDLAVHYLMRGVDVMMVNARGYGESTGVPTSHKTKLDLETAYQYLSKKQKVENKDLLVHGHCIGGGSATDLAARRQGVNLLLDRSFSTFEEQSKYIAYDYCSDFKYTLETILPKWKDFFEKFFSDKYDEESKWGKIRNKITLLTKEHDIPEKLSNVIAKVMSWGISYNNTENLQKIKGKIALVLDSNDGFIKKDAGRKQMNSCNERKIIITNVGHGPSWINVDRSDSWLDRISNKQKNRHHFSTEFNEFLMSANLYRKVF